MALIKLGAKCSNCVGVSAFILNKILSANESFIGAGFVIWLVHIN